MLLTRGLSGALKDLKREIKLYRRHHAAVAKARELTGPLRLNFGSGTLRKSGWVNIDLFAEAADLQLDAREPLPFADGTVDTIYSEHFLEHLDYPFHTVPFLKECVRVLKSDGIFSVGVPDTEWPLLAYAKDEHGYFPLARAKFHPPWCTTKLHQINYHFRQGRSHKYAYDFETLAAVLAESGFAESYRRDFDPKLDSEHRRIGSLYVEARKTSPRSGLRNPGETL